MSKKETAQLIMIKPLADRVLVRPNLNAEEKSQSGFIIPDTARKEKPERGEVLAVGPGKSDEHGKAMGMQVKVGDIVIFSKYGYDEVKVNNEDLYILSEASILAVIN